MTNKKLTFLGRVKRKSLHLKNKIIKPKPIKPHDVEYIGNEYVNKEQDASDLIFKTLNQEKPCLIGRFGTTESAVIEYFLDNKNWYCEFPEELKERISDLSGFFPSTNNALIRFCCESIAIMKNIDILGIRAEWADNVCFETERKFITRFASSAKLIKTHDLLPFFDKNPWTAYLENKKVLVIHPFEETIRSQYAKRDLLFKNPKFLPKFELKTIKAVQGLADSKKNLPFVSWFEALDSMYKKIDATDFDVAIIGAGAYGLFLADYCKRKGKKAIVMGGALQLFFGIKGKRWDDMPEWSKQIYNEHWTYASDKDKPKNYTKVEEGCYW
jgi:hypothetical protein